MYRVNHCQYPQSILDLFSKKDKVPRISRQYHQYITPRSRCKAFENSIAIQGPKKCNQFLKTFDLKCSIHTYKKTTKSTPTEYTHINRNISVVNLPTVLVYSLCKNVIIVKYFEINVYVITSFYFSHSNYC